MWNIVSRRNFPFRRINDAYDAVKYVHDNAVLFGIDPDRMAVGGHSAGANISAVLCLMAKKTGEFAFRSQILDYPPLDLHTCAFEKRNPKEGIPPMIATMFDDCYTKPEERTDIYASPVRSTIEDLRGLPPACIITADLDSLRDEAKLYAEKLERAGVAVKYHNYENVPHGFTIEAFSPLALYENNNKSDRPMSEAVSKAGESAFEEITGALREHLVK